MLAVASTLAVSLFVVAAILIAADRRRKAIVAAQKAARFDADAIDTVAGWPPNAVRVMTGDERRAYDLTRRALPKHLVLAQVPLARFISVPADHSYKAWLQRAGRLSVDLLITDATSRPVAAIEIHNHNESPSSAKRHRRLREVLEAAGIPVYVWIENKLPTLIEARDQLRTLMLKGEDEFETAPAKSHKLPVAEVKEITADPRDPVHSTFYDDFDVLPPSRPLVAKFG
jgi:DNA-binding LacI/PurR family transcriptional regulator